MDVLSKSNWRRAGDSGMHAHAASLRRFRALRAALANAHALTQLRTLSGSNPPFPSNGKRTPGWTSFPSQTGGELGIRTPDALLGHTRLAGEHLRPLGQLSVTAVISYPTRTRLHKKRNTSLQNSLADIPVAGPAPIAKTCSVRSVRHCRAHATSGTRNARPRRKSRFRPAGPQHRQYSSRPSQ